MQVMQMKQPRNEALLFFFFTLELASKDFSKKFIVAVASAAAKKTLRKKYLELTARKNFLNIKPLVVTCCFDVVEINICHK